MPRFLVTGATGQIGSYVCERLLRGGHEVLGVARPERSSPLPKGVLPATGAFSSEGLEPLLFRNGTLDAVLHFGAQTSVPDSWKHPEETFHVNATLVLQASHALAIRAKHTRFIFAASSNMFGIPETLPLTEASTLRPVSPYGLSKASAFLGVRFAREALGAPHTNLILFLAASARAKQDHVVRRITRQVADMVNGRGVCVSLGSLHLRRDISHADDFARVAEAAAVGTLPADDYVCASGTSYSVGDIALLALGLAGISDERALQEDPTYVRRNDIPHLEGSPRKLRERGLAPSRTLRDVVEECLAEDLREGRLHPE